MGLKKEEVRFVKGIETLAGLHIERRPVRMPQVGGFWRRDDAKKLVEYAAQIGITVTYASHPNIYDPRAVHGISDRYL